jgi:hypothetical protein
LEKIATLLIEKEYISGEEFAEMIDHPDTIASFEGKKGKKEEKKETKVASSRKKTS